MRKLVIHALIAASLIAVSFPAAADSIKGFYKGASGNARAAEWVQVTGSQLQ
jgi:hypothetical protein